MFYKKENNSWLRGFRINLPSGEVLNAQNKVNSDGWVWYDEPPMDYLMDIHEDGFTTAVSERQSPISVNDISTLLISQEVLENRLKKTFSVAYLVDGSYFYAENLQYEGILTEKEIKEKVLNLLNNL
jgi:hypothetical protein